MFLVRNSWPSLVLHPNAQQCIGISNFIYICRRPWTCRNRISRALFDRPHVTLVPVCRMTHKQHSQSSIFMKSLEHAAGSSADGAWMGEPAISAYESVVGRPLPAEWNAYREAQWNFWRRCCGLVADAEIDRLRQQPQQQQLRCVLSGDCRAVQCNTWEQTPGSP